MIPHKRNRATTSRETTAPINFGNLKDLAVGNRTRRDSPLESFSSTEQVDAWAPTVRPCWRRHLRRKSATLLVLAAASGIVSVQRSVAM